MVDLAKVTADDFRPFLEQDFLLRAGETQISLRLAEVEERRVAVKGGRQPFSLLFQGPASPAFTQGNFPLQHERLGTLEVFLVAIAGNASSRTYEAVFS
ncbi:MAG TPA: hypothetical protein VF511_04555 [Chthoniobacterales bacterium]|jgi:hypothetical protein